MADPTLPPVSEDVLAALLGRPLTDDEYTRAIQLLEIWWPDVLDLRPCPEAVLKPNWISVIGELVVDRLSNPNKLASESLEVYSYTRQAGTGAPTAVSDLSASDVGRIWGGCESVGGNVFTITTTIPCWP